MTHKNLLSIRNLCKEIEEKDSNCRAELQCVKRYDFIHSRHDSHPCKRCAFW